MNPNLVSTVTFTYKDLLLRKLYYSVLCSVFSQLLILFLFLLFNNFNLFHPIEWIISTVLTLTSFTTWLYLIPLLIIILGQSIICAKDYAFKSVYCSTRFQKFVSVFSVHNLVLLTLHILVGGILVWMFLSLSGGPYQNLTSSCKDKLCIVEGTFFLILGGFFTGLYFFVKVYISEKHLVFPVIHQRKLLQFKASVFPLLKESFACSAWPTCYYIILYYIWGNYYVNGFKGFFGLLPQENSDGMIIYLFAWMFGALYYFNMNLMRFFFNLFLTEPVEFSLVQQSENSLTLQNSITMSNFPIIQSLACLDLKVLSQWSPVRRQVFFTLSQPGGHPHNWNNLIENVLKLTKEYTDLLNKSTENIGSDKYPSGQAMISPMCNSIQSPDRFRNLRNMSMMYNQDVVDVVEISQTPLPGVDLPETILTKLKEKINNFFSLLKVILGINFIFGELPQANIQKCLANGHLIIWLSQGVSELICASLVEDRYGIVQKDLPVIITSLVELKQSLDRLNKVPALTRKIAGYEDFNYKMKGAVTMAVKRSLLNICRNFDKYLSEFPLSKEVVLQLQPFICKS